MKTTKAQIERIEAEVEAAKKRTGDTSIRAVTEKGAVKFVDRCGSTQWMSAPAALAYIKSY